MSEPTIETPEADIVAALPEVAGAEANPSVEAAAPVAPTRIGWLLPVLTLLWLVGKLWASRQQIHGAQDSTIALATGAAALPGVFQAALVAAIGGALLTTAWTLRPVLRWAAAITAGVIIGGATGALIAVAYPHLPSIGSIVVAMIACGAIGGALAAIPRASVPVAAGVAGTLGVLIAMTVLNSSSVLSHMLTMFGGDSSAASFVHASKLVQYTDFTIAGIIAGIVAFAYLRRRSVRSFPIYLLAGATAGFLVLIAFALTSIGGADLLNAAKSLSDADRLINDWESSESVPNAMIVLFVGAFVALVAFGRTLKPRSK